MIIIYSKTKNRRVYFTFIQTSLMSSLTENVWIWIHCSVGFWLQDMKKILAYMQLEKLQCISKAFPGIYIYTYLQIYDTNSKRCGFQNRIHWSYTLKNLLPIYDFITSGIGHLKNTGSLGFVSLPNVDIFHYPVSKTHIYQYLISKVSKYWQSLEGQ